MPQGHGAWPACDIAEQIVRDLPVAEGNGGAVGVCLDQLCGVYAKLRAEYAVIGAGRAAALHMAGHDAARLNAHQSAQLLGNAMTHRLVGIFGEELGALLLFHGQLLRAQSALRNGNDGKAFALFGALIDDPAHFID